MSENLPVDESGYPLCPRCGYRLAKSVLKNPEWALCPRCLYGLERIYKTSLLPVSYELSGRWRTLAIILISLLFIFLIWNLYMVSRFPLLNRTL